MQEEAKMRDPKRAPLNRWVHVRLNAEEESALGQLQSGLGARCRSELLRQLIREAVGQGPDLLKPELQAFSEAVRELTALGRNLNQIARALNKGQPTGLPWDSSL